MSWLSPSNLGLLGIDEDYTSAIERWSSRGCPKAPGESGHDLCQGYLRSAIIAARSLEVRRLVRRKNGPGLSLYAVEDAVGAGEGIGPYSLSELRETLDKGLWQVHAHIGIERSKAAAAIVRSVEDRAEDVGITLMPRPRRPSAAAPPRPPEPMPYGPPRPPVLSVGSRLGPGAAIALGVGLAAVGLLLAFPGGNQ